MVRARQARTDIDIGFVGEATSIDTTVVNRLIAADIIPVIYPMGIGRGGNLYNVNADHVASKVAIALRAEKFFVAS